MKTYYGLGVLVLVIIGGIWLYAGQSSTPSAAVLPANTYGMSQYHDMPYGFTFWYPSATVVTASTTHDQVSFPGGVVVEELRIGSEGDITLFVVDAPTSAITDEPSGHASPIAQTKYFYNNASSTWMTAFPDSVGEGSARATTTADVSQTTMSGLLMLKSGRRFNTTIMPLSATRFIVVTDGGGSMFTNQLAKTVTPTSATIDPLVLANALQAEASAYATQ